MDINPAEGRNYVRSARHSNHVPLNMNGDTLGTRGSGEPEVTVGGIERHPSIVHDGAHGEYGAIAWHGVELKPDKVSAAVGRIREALMSHGIAAGGEVELIVGDGAPSVLVFWALISHDCSILLTQMDEYSQLPRSGKPLIIAESEDSFPEDVIDLRPLVKEIVFCARENISMERQNEPLLTLLDCRQRWFRRPFALGIWSTGTTGAPSIVWKSGMFLVANSKGTAQHLRYTADDVMLPLLPLGHQYGASVMLISLLQGASIVLCNRRRMGEIVRTIERHRVTAVDAVPRLYQAFVAHVATTKSAQASVAGVRVWGVGGGPLPGGLHESFRTLLGKRLLDGYGSTEFGNVAICRPGDESGRMSALPCFQLRVVDADNGSILPAGIVGILDVLPLVPVRPDVDQAWLSTGDLAVQDPEGRIRVLGRAGSISRNGYTIFPAAITAKMNDAGVPAVAVSVDGDPNGAFWLVVHDKLRRPARWWRRRARELLQDYEMPNHIEVLRFVPTKLDQKVDLGALQRLVQELSRVKTNPGARGDLTSVMVDRVLNAKEEILLSASETTSIAVAQNDLSAMVEVLQNAPAEMALYQPAASPPVYVCMPANACLESLALYALVPALWSTNVIVRPARGTERLVNKVVEILSDVLDGRIQTWFDEQARFVDEAAKEPGVFIFCGLKTNLAKIQSRLTKRHMIMFFGRGFNPAVVAQAADVDSAALTTAVDRMYAGGQDCLAPNITFVHESVWDEFYTRLTRHVGRLNEGHPDWPASTALPAQRPRNVQEAHEYLLTHRDHIQSGGLVDTAGLTISPTILVFDFENAPRPQENFGPIFTLVIFNNLEEVLGLLTSDVYLRNALGMTAWGVAEDRLQVLAKNYMIGVEQSLFCVSKSFEPFGGSGPEAGYVRYRGRQWTGPLNVSKSVKDHWRDGGRAV